MLHFVLYFVSNPNALLLWYILGRTAPPPPAAGKSVVELERVINAMKRVIEKLQKENAQMKSQLDSSAKHKEVSQFLREFICQ